MPVYPISVRPPRAGDGSRLCEPLEQERSRPDRGGEWYARKVQKKLKEKRRKAAYAAFREMFSEGV